MQSKPIHIVSGFYRSGTSAMMQALIAGGLTAAWSEERNQVAEQHADEHYHPNKAGLFEIALKEYQLVNFPLAYEGKLIKVMLWGLDHLAVHEPGYRVVIMRRDPEEIRQSYEGFFGRRCPSLAEYDLRIARAEALLANRRDVLSVTVVNYRDLVEQPDLTLSRLCLWPIDPVKAAATVDPEQYRFRLERLTVGI
jgi:hypothetical protein